MGGGAGPPAKLAQPTIFLFPSPSEVVKKGPGSKAPPSLRVSHRSHRPHPSIPHAPRNVGTSGYFPQNILISIPVSKHLNTYIFVQIWYFGQMSFFLKFLYIIHEVRTILRLSDFEESILSASERTLALGRPRPRPTRCPEDQLASPPTHTPGGL